MKHKTVLIIGLLSAFGLLSILSCWMHFEDQGHTHSHDSQEALQYVGKLAPKSISNLSALVLSCAECHGDSGQGNREKHAPSLAGMPEWYLNKQMQMFVDGRRQIGPTNDPAYESSQLMLEQLKKLQVEERSALAHHYAKLKPFKIKNSFGGDPKSGYRIYNGRGACINCHRPDAKGYAGAGAPPLTIIPDWYFAKQIELYQKGFRGAHTQEEIIECMIVASKRLSQQDCYDVIAYVASLAN